MNLFEFNLTIPEPFNFRLTVQKPAGWHWATPFEVFEDETLFTALRLADSRLVGMALKAEDESVKARAFSDSELTADERLELVERVKLGLGTDEDLEGFYALAGTDALVDMLKNDLYGMRVGLADDVFDRALLAICLQMAPTRRSDQMMMCLIERYGDSIGFDGKEILYWPAATAIASTPTEELSATCNLGHRAKAIKKVARAIAQVEAEALKRWGRYRWHVFVYVLHDLPQLAKHYRITKPI